MEGFADISHHFAQCFLLLVFLEMLFPLLPASRTFTKEFLFLLPFKFVFKAIQLLNIVQLSRMGLVRNAKMDFIWIWTETTVKKEQLCQIVMPTKIMKMRVPSAKMGLDRLPTFWNVLKILLVFAIAINIFHQLSARFVRRECWQWMENVKSFLSKIKLKTANFIKLSLEQCNARPVSTDTFWTIKSVKTLKCVTVENLSRSKNVWCVNQITLLSNWTESLPAPRCVRKIAEW